MAAGLDHLLAISSGYRQKIRDDFYQVDANFLTPGYWVAFSAKALSEGLEDKNILFPNKDMAEYASALGFSKLLWGEDNYHAARVNEGVNYSTLTLLDLPEATDKATGHINNCIRRLLPDSEHEEFISQLCDVVGDLHDNVWSHGRSSGVSMAQKWRTIDHHEHYLEFALADCGLGFKAELSRVGNDCESDQHAIEWCIQEGNSTKKQKITDDFAQRMPGDIIDNPLPGIGTPQENDNHHMGLGLAKLIQLVQKYHGELWLASGTDMLIIDSNGKQRYENVGFSWKGVALACRFCTSDIKRALVNITDPEIASLMEMLRR